MIRIVFFMLMLTVPALADSGLVRLRAHSGPWSITLMSDPTPLRAGPIDLSVMVQNDAGQAVLDATVKLTLELDGLRMEVPATRDQADNQLLYAAKFSLPQAGDWFTTVRIGRDEHAAEMTVMLPARSARPPIQSAWPWLLPVPLALGFYALNRSLRAPAAATTGPAPT